VIDCHHASLTSQALELPTRYSTRQQGHTLGQETALARQRRILA
jgi:hypothetical protein